MSGSTEVVSTGRQLLSVLALAALLTQPLHSQQVPPRTMVIAAQSDLQLVNSLVNNDAWTTEVIRNLLFLPLVRVNPDLTHAPALAESWQFSGDTAVTFRIRRDVRWHDGRRTTAHDVAFTFERAKDPATAFPQPYFARWRSAQVLDSFTIRFRLEPHVDPLLTWVEVSVMPKHLLDSIPAARMRQAAFNKAPVGNGPFRFVSETPNDRWVFGANTDFPRALGGRPRLDRVVWRVIPDNTAQETALLTGEVDIALGLRAEQVKKLSDRPDLRVLVRPPTQYAALMWNSRRPALSDVRVRRALTMALNRQQLITVLRNGYGQVASTPVPPWHWAYDRSITPLPYDLSGARRLLNAAGYTSARPLELVLKVPNVASARDLAEMVRAGLADAGVKVAVQPIDFAALIQDVNGARDFDGVFLAATVDSRLDFTDLFHSRSAKAWFHTPALDKLLDEAMVETNREKAARIWRSVQTTIVQEQPWTLVWWGPQFVVTTARVQDISVDVRGVFRTLPSWSIRRE